MADVFETNDLEEAHDYLTRAYGSMRLSVIGDRQQMRLVHHAFGPLRLHHNTFPMKFHVDAQPLGVMIFGRIRNGQVSYRAAGREMEAGAGEVLLGAHPDLAYQAIVDDLDIELVIIDPMLLAQVASTAPSRAPRPVRLLDHRPISAEAARMWTDTHTYLRGTLIGNSIAAMHPLLVGNMARVFAATVLSVFPNDALQDPTAEDRRDAHPAALRRAVAFIDDNAQRDICAADIAESAHVTIRTLQLAFRRYLDTTPMAYLRRVRLKHAHEDLLHADPARVTVGSVAARWGFDHHSRFTANYRAVYGVTPSITLRRR